MNSDAVPGGGLERISYHNLPLGTVFKMGRDRVVKVSGADWCVLEEEFEQWVAGRAFEKIAVRDDFQALVVEYPDDANDRLNRIAKRWSAILDSSDSQHRFVDLDGLIASSRRQLALLTAKNLEEETPPLELLTPAVPVQWKDVNVGDIFVALDGRVYERDGSGYATFLAPDMQRWNGKPNKSEMVEVRGTRPLADAEQVDLIYRHIQAA